MHRLAALLDFHRDDPGDPFTRFALAQEYLKVGDDAQALSFFEGLVLDHPDYVGTYYHLGKLYERLGRAGAAVEAYRAGVAAATRANDLHARSELQGALLAAEGLGFDDE
jgi:predicted Zn-dependent protease